MAVSGRGGRIQRPSQFVISEVMFFNCLSPVADCYLRLREIPSAALTPCWGSLDLYLRPGQQETSKLLILITQKDSWPGSGMWSPPGSRLARRWKDLSFLTRRRKPLVMSVRFCSQPDHTHVHVNTADRTQARAHFQTPTDVAAISRSHSDGSFCKRSEDVEKCI